LAALASVDTLPVDVQKAPKHRTIDSVVARAEALAERQKNALIRRRVVALIETERFDEAWAMLGQLPKEAQTTLLVAVVNMAKGLFDDVERSCHALISAGHAESDAHCLLGICREHQRAFDSAERHYREAARLDGRFAMPHLRLGLLLDRSGDAARGRIELEQAAEWIGNEDPERIALFGGGFSRKVLLELCNERLAARTG
jgi:chemotaxis protein methyltransferase CheR